VALSSNQALHRDAFGQGEEEEPQEQDDVQIKFSVLVQETENEAVFSVRYFILALKNYLVLIVERKKYLVIFSFIAFATP
jgi:hypothetical protein